jgi:nitrilase
VIGVSERVESGPGSRTLYNSLLTFGPDGRLLNHHRKLMPTFSERMVWGLGDAEGLRAVETPVGRVGGLICWEHWMPLARQALHDVGEDVHVAAWPTVKELNLVASRHYAFEGRCFVLAVGGLLHRDALPPELEPHPSALEGGEWLLHGGSCVIGPDGHYVVEPVYDREALVLARLDRARMAEEAMALDTSGHYSRPDCLRLERIGGSRRRSVEGEDTE